MNKNLNCEIIRDLLPSYVDGLTNEITGKIIENHLAYCKDCADAVLLMRQPLKLIDRPNKASEV